MQKRSAKKSNSPKEKQRKRQTENTHDVKQLSLGFDFVNTVQNTDSIYFNSHASEFYEQRGFWVAQYDYQEECILYYNIKTGVYQHKVPSEWSFNIYDDRARYRDENLIKIRTAKAAAEAQLARLQVTQETRPTVLEGAYDLNIWYGRYKSEMFEKDTREPATTKCNPITDSGKTKAQLYASKEKLWFCFHFAKGQCHMGTDCNFLHALPDDNTHVDLAHDVFGRERFAAQREDRGGVGGLDTECRTLYIGGLGRHDDLMKALWDAFGYFGEIDDLKIIDRKNIAFVTYKNRGNAEFAKVAMSNQLLEGQEMLNVRWANEDPNPRAAAEKVERYKKEWVQAAVSRGFKPAHFGSCLVYDEYGNACEPYSEYAARLQQQEQYSQRTHCFEGAMSKEGSPPSTRPQKKSDDFSDSKEIGPQLPKDQEEPSSEEFKKQEASKELYESYSRLSKALTAVDSHILLNDCFAEKHTAERHNAKEVLDPWRQKDYQSS